ncbi:MAG: D-2-hydroxyacid dehydrogenase [Acidimicrobiales bacterium]
MTERLVIGVLYPPDWNDDFDDDLDRLRAIDPRIEVIAERYVEPFEARTGRGVPPYDDIMHLVPELTDAQRDVFGRIDCCMAIDLPFDVADVAPNLRWVQGVGAGIAQLQSAGLHEAGIRLTNGSGLTSAAIAEFVWARILGEYKRTRDLDAVQADHKWTPVYGEQIAGKTIALIGFGPINQAVAALARAFGLRVLCLRRSAAADPLIDEVFGPDQLHSMLGQADITVGAVPESAATENLMDAASFASMPAGSMFVNVGRGTLVDEDALADALTTGHLRAAAIDVARVEPLPADSPLWQAPNLYLSAHCSTDPTKLFENLHRLFEDNVRRFIAGEPLRNEVAG